MFEKSRDLVTDLLFGYYSSGDLTIYEGLKIVTDYLGERGVFSMKELPTEEVWADALTICDRINEHVNAKRDAE
jgi:hypothetical protein